MKFYRSISVIVLVIATWLIPALGLPEASALESSQLHTDFSQVQKYAKRLTPLQTRLLELEPLIKDNNWSEVQSFLRGSLGDFEVRLRFLETSFPLPQRGEVSKKIDKLSKYFTQLDSSAVAGNKQKSLEKFDALINEFNEILSLAGTRAPLSQKSLPSQSSLKKKSADALVKKSQSVPTEILPSASTKVGYRPSKPERDLKETPLEKDSITDLSSSQLDKDLTDTTLSISQNTMDTNLSPDLTYLALLFLIPLTIYLQIRYQHKRQEDQDRVAELEGKIEALNQDKENLGSALEQTQGRLVTMFMNLEETKPVARLLHHRTVTVEEQEDLIQENDSFVQALLEQAQETVLPDKSHIEES